MAATINSRSSPTDVLIIGAGPSGLATVLGLSRLLHTCIVFSTSKFRNDPSKHMHGVPTWEHRDPADFREATKKDILAHYHTAAFENVSITKLEKMEREDGSSLFKAIDESGKEWWGRKVVIATGITDVMLDIPGYKENWSSSIFHCLFCHGYEERGAASAGVLAIGDLEAPLMSLFVSRFANRLAQKITIYTNGNTTVTEEFATALAALKPTSKSAQNLSVDSRKIIKLVKGSKNAEIEVHLEDGSVKVEGFLAHAPKGVVNGPFIEQLGLEKTPHGKLVVTAPFNETSVTGVFGVGDAALMMAAVMPGIASGGATAAGIAAQLGAED